MSPVTAFNNSPHINRRAAHALDRHAFTDTSQNYTDIDYGIQTTSSEGTNGVWIYEAGTSRVSGGTYSSGDKFRVAVEGGVVKYYKISGGNQTLLYTSTVAPTYPLLVDSSLYSTGTTLSNVMLSSGNGSSSANINWLVTDHHMLN